MSKERFIAICCVCNNVRDDSSRMGVDHEWGPMDAYLTRHGLRSGEYRLTHAYCPSCSSKFSRRESSPVGLTPPMTESLEPIHAGSGFRP